MAINRVSFTGGGVKQTPRERAGYGDYNNAKSNLKNIMNQTGNSPSAIVQRGRDYVAQFKNTDSYGSGGGGYEGGGSSYHSTSDDIVAKIKALLEQQKTASDEYAKTLYEQALAQNKESYKSNQRQANLNYMRSDRYLKSLYGDAISGQGLSNLSRNRNHWNNSDTANRLAWTNNDASAKASYNANLANNASTLAQGWYNYVLPVYTNRQTQLDNLEYRKYLASL